MGHIWVTPVPPIGLWTLSPRFSPTLSPRSFFFNWSAVSHLKSRDFRFHEPTILFDHWSAVSPTGNDMTRSPNWTLDFEPAVFPHLEPTILFFNWSAVSHLKSRDFRFHEPTILFDHWSAVSPTGNDMTSSSGHVIALDQSGASICHILADFTTQVTSLKGSKDAVKQIPLTSTLSFFLLFINLGFFSIISIFLSAN